MSQQYPPPPGYGQAPPPQPYYPPQAPAPAPYPPQQQYAQPYAQPAPQPPPQPQVDASLDDFWDQPNTGGGAGVSWTNKPDGWGFDFIVARDVTKGDIQAQTKPRNAGAEAGQLVTYADGRPKLQMIVSLRVGTTPEWPDGEARLFVRGQMREELARAMIEAGCQPGVSPKEGDTGRVVLAYRKPNPPLNPSNIFQISYQAGPKHAALAAAPSNGQAPAPAPQAAPQQPTQAAPPPPPQAPAQPQAPAMPQPPAQAAAPPPPPPSAPAAAAPQQPQAPAQPVQSPPPPADMTPSQAQVMQTIAGGATVPPPPAPAQG